MTQLSSRPPVRPQAAPARQALPGLPSKALTPQQQLEALARVQNQAEQRVRLGLQLFKAAEAHTTSHQQILEDITAEREKFRDEISKDVARSLHAFDQWIGQMDDTFTQAFLTLEERVDSVEQKLVDQQRHLETMIRQTQKMLDQATALLDGQTIAPTPTSAAFDATSKLNQSVLKGAPERPETVEKLPTVVTSDIRSFIKPVPPVKLTALPQPEEAMASHDDSQNDSHADVDSDSEIEENHICQTVSYADILDRIYASRKQINQD